MENFQTPKILEDDSTFVDKDGADIADDIPDLADEEDDPVADAHEKIDSILGILDGSLSVEQAYMLYAEKVDPKYWEAQAAVSKLVSNMQLDTIQKFISILEAEVDAKKKQKDLAEELEAKKKQKESANEPEPKKEKTKTLITIKKGLQEKDIKEYIKQINTKLTDEKTDVVDIHCPDWTNSNTHPCLIPACKKLLVKYCEIGLLGCLIDHDYQKLAHELYCFAYAKGKLLDQKIQFTNIDINDYKIKASESVKAFWILVDKQES